jgi:hypothetical protein
MKLPCGFKLGFRDKIQPEKKFSSDDYGIQDIFLAHFTGDTLDSTDFVE